MRCTSLCELSSCSWSLQWVDVFFFFGEGSAMALGEISDKTRLDRVVTILHDLRYRRA